MVKWWSVPCLHCRPDGRHSTTKAIERVASCEGAPGGRASVCYGAYVQDLSGHQIASFRFSPQMLEQPGH